MILDVFLNHNAKLRHPELAVGTYGYIGVFKGTFSLKKRFKFRKFFPTRPEGAEALSPGQKDTSSTPCFTLIEQALSAFFNVNYV